MDAELLARIDENVKYLVKARVEDKAAFDAHVEKDEKIVNEFIRPLWENRQQNIGAASARNYGGQLIGYGINAIIAVTAAWAAVKGLSK